MIIPILQIVVGLALVVVILLQRRSSDLGSAFGGSGSGEFFYAKRGVEKILFDVTIALAVIFFALTIANVAGLTL